MTTIIALTGGVGTGKSTAARLFRELAADRLESLDCDVVVHELLTRPGIAAKLSQIFGDGILTSDGLIDRGNLRRIVFEDDAQRRKLESILHPEVLEECRRAKVEALNRNRPPTFLLYEVPLLYEAEFPLERDVDIAVGASHETQTTRIRDSRDLTNDLIKKMISAQMPVQEKMDRAGVVLWNDGPESVLREQVHLALSFLNSRFA